MKTQTLKNNRNLCQQSHLHTKDKNIRSITNYELLMRLNSAWIIAESNFEATHYKDTLPHFIRSMN